MVDKEIISSILCYLEEIGWSELICSRWKKEVVNDIKQKFPDINNETIDYILKIVLV